LTGGIASGKTRVAEMFVELGAALVDTDLIAREVVSPGEPALAAVRAAFGDGVIATDGGLDRAALRKLVFRDAESRRKLEAILHPAIRARTLARADAADGPYVVIAVPLLVETAFAAHVDRVLVVDCTPAVQLARLIQRDGIDESEARAMMAAQVDRDARLAAADDVVDNSGTIEQTRSQVVALHRHYLQLSDDCRGTPARAE
jgi:dephospho-CoA kinase